MAPSEGNTFAIALQPSTDAVEGLQTASGQSAHACDSRVQGGAGLGPSLCKRAVEGCGSIIGYQNNPIKSATFRFELPRPDL